jgi:hypothetical protein
VEEDDDFIGPGGGADKAKAALQLGAEDRAALNCMVNKANEGAKETLEERRSNIVW